MNPQKELLWGLWVGSRVQGFCVSIHGFGVRGLELQASRVRFSLQPKPDSRGCTVVALCLEP